MPEFKVVSEYTPSGDQPKAIEKLAEGLENGLRQQVLLGVTEDGGLRRCFSRELLAPAGELRRGVLWPCGGEAPERRGFLSRLPEMARTARQGRCVRAVVPWREGEPFPIPELFCFASVGQGRVTYLFDGEGRPIMPK